MIDLSFLQQYPLLSYEFFGNPLSQYLVAVAVALVVYGVLKLFKKRIVNNLDDLSEKTANEFDDLLVDVVQSIGTPFYLFVSLGVGVQFIDQPEMLRTIVSYIAIGVVIYTVVRILQQVVSYIFQRNVKKRLEEDPRFDDSAVKLLSRAINVVIWIVVILFVVQNDPFNYDITALVAGLGIGGIAIAFALQSVLSDIFASFTIYFDKPFRTGDFIVVGDMLGTVKHIGIQSTRIQSLWGEEIVIPNKDLTSARIKNYKQMETRRIKFQFGVTYQTSAAKVKKIPDMVRKIIEDIELAELNRVHFFEFGDSSLNFEVMYVVDSPEYEVYMDIQQEINLTLMAQFQKEGIEFAYPTQTIYLEKQGSNS